MDDWKDGGPAWTPEANRVPTCLLTADELAALKAAKHGWVCSCSATNWEWEDMGMPRWHDGSIYRAKPAPAPTLSITVNGVTNVVAAGVTEALKDGQQFWVMEFDHPEWTRGFVWRGHRADLRMLSRGLIHLTEAAARAHAMAMLGLKAEGV